MAPSDPTSSTEGLAFAPLEDAAGSSMVLPEAMTSSGTTAVDAAVLRLQAVTTTSPRSESALHGLMDQGVWLLLASKMLFI